MTSLSEVRLYGGPNPGGVWDVALDEALLRTTCEDQGPLTIRIWQSTSPALILPRSPLPKEEALIRYCTSESIHMTRAISGRRPLMLGQGVLNLSLVDKSTALKSGSLEAEVAELLSPLLDGIRSVFSLSELTFEQGYLLSETSAFGMYNTSYYFDYLLIQGMIILHANKHPTALMTSRDGVHIRPLDQIHSDASNARFIDSIIQSISENYGVQLNMVVASARETDLMNELYQWKYTNDDWVYHQSEPLALGRVLLEGYLAYPPTARCRTIMAIIDDISQKYSDKVECRIWLRGKGLISWLKGIPPGLRPSGGVVQASKKNIVPAIVVEGKITHERIVPIYDDLCRIVEEAHDAAFGGISK